MLCGLICAAFSYTDYIFWYNLIQIYTCVAFCGLISVGCQYCLALPGYKCICPLHKGQTSFQIWQKTYVAPIQHVHEAPSALIGRHIQVQVLSSSHRWCKDTQAAPLAYLGPLCKPGGASPTNICRRIWQTHESGNFKHKHIGFGQTGQFWGSPPLPWELLVALLVAAASSANKQTFAANS